MQNIMKCPVFMSVYPAFCSWDMHVYLAFLTIYPKPPSFMQLTHRILKIYNSLLIATLWYLIFSHSNCGIFFEIPIMVTSRIRAYKLWKAERTTAFWGVVCEDKNINKFLRFEDLSLHQKTQPLFLTVFHRMCHVYILIRK
jgi:hypothetical protein